MPEHRTAPPTADSVGTLRLPARVHFGFGARAQLPEAVAVHGRRVLVVIDPFLTGTPVLQDILAGLDRAGLQHLVYSEVTPELPVSTLDAAAATARDFGPEVIAAVGGGSALDAAKLIAVLCTHDGPLSRYYGENLVPGRVVPVVAVPTTAGTGSEVTPVAVVSDPERDLKVGISSPFLVPAAAIVDPELTLGAPARVTAFSGIDALVHAVESYTARTLGAAWPEPLPVFTGRNALAEPIALQAAAHLGPWLPRAVDEPGDRQARHEVARGSLLAGMAFGSTGTHLCHALQYPIGAITKTPHGLGTGLMLPYVLDALRGEAEVADRIATIGAAITGAAAGEVTAALTIDRIVGINRRIGVPATLADIGVTREQLPQIAELGLRSSRLVTIAPVTVTADLLLDMLTRAHAGKLTDRSTE